MTDQKASPQNVNTPSQKPASSQPTTHQTTKSRQSTEIQYSIPLTPEKLSDEKLFLLCKKFGANAIGWKRKFIGLLPEANRRRLYQRKRFSSIFEFAFLLGGVSSAQVTLAISLDRCFEDKPVIRDLLTRGLVSINKLARVASVVTKESEQFWAKQVQLLSYRALETLVRDHRMANKTEEENNPGPLFENFKKTEGTNTDESVSPTANATDSSVFSPTAGDATSIGLATQEFSFQNNFSNAKTDRQDGFQKPQTGREFLRAQNFQLDPNILKLQLSTLTISKLLELQNKGIDINKIILDLIAQRETQIIRTKEQLSATLTTSQGRYIPVQVKKIIAAEHGQKCSIKTCAKPAAVLHHTQRFALAGTHDPNYMAPLCRQHHLIAHSIDAKFHEVRGKGSEEHLQKPPGRRF